MFQLKFSILENYYILRSNVILFGKLSIHFIIDVNELFKWPRIDRLDYDEVGWQFAGLGICLSISRLVKRESLMLNCLVSSLPEVSEVEKKTLQAIHEKYGEAIAATTKMIQINSSKGQREACITFHMLGEERIVLQALAELLTKSGYQVYQKGRGLKILW